MHDIDLKLKKGFREIFPDYARQLDAAKNQTEVEKLQQIFISEARENLARALGKEVEALGLDDETACIPLTKDLYDVLKDATGNTIKSQLLVLFDGLQRLKDKEHDDNGLIVAQLLLSGALGIGAIATSEVVSGLIAGAAATVAAAAGVSVATVGVVVAIAVLVIVTILIPIIYFMNKAANCVILLINELDNQLLFLEDYNVSGKPKLMTSAIPSGATSPNGDFYAVAGLIATEKKNLALVGTQYGFTMKYKDYKLSFGVECPLTSIMTDNNCYCAIGETAEEVAEKTAKENKQSWINSKDGINLSIRCNSGSGSIAFYVARAYKG